MPDAGALNLIKLNMKEHIALIHEGKLKEDTLVICFRCRGEGEIYHSHSGSCVDIEEKFTWSSDDHLMLLCQKSYHERDPCPVCKGAKSLLYGDVLIAPEEAVFW